jgi:hypothetical protein
MKLIKGQGLLQRATASCVVVAAVLGGAGDGLAQAPAPFEITDNSFLVEEAFNQEPGIFQNILTIGRPNRAVWENAFTQEWPVVSQRHQLSFTIPYTSTGSASGAGDAYVHYRLQVLDGGDARPAFSPRVSLIVPSGSTSTGLGNGSFGWELNLPFSKQLRDVFLHWNAGVTQLPSARIDGRDYNLITPRVAGSAIWRVRPMFNLMFESVVEWEEGVVDGQTARATTVTILPGFRTGWDVGKSQVITGVGVPLTIRGEGDSAGLFLYFSYELPFVRN